jgi:eukaryotic-like serine/threonine-protein kinase
MGHQRRAVRLNPDLPPKLVDIIDKALEKDRDLRYQSAADMRSDLQRLRRDSESTKLPAAPAPRKRLPWIKGAALLRLAAAGAAYFLLHKRAPKLTEKDTIVLADFANTTGDPVFDGTLRQGLSAQLEQSPFLNLLSDQRIAQSLALMSQPKDARLTKEVSREVCQRAASAATIEGSIASLGSQYVLGLKAVNCRTGDPLAQEQVTANGKEEVLKALGDAATKLRGKLGESLASVQKFEAPPENVTTPSLEALQAYSLGYHTFDVTNDIGAAIPLFQRASSLDPNFATAYLGSALSYFALSEPIQAADSMRKAYALRERTSEREKLAISSFYELLISGNLESARTRLELWAQTYPRDDQPQAWLWLINVQLGELQNSLRAGQEAVKLNPGSANNYVNLVYAYQWVNRLDKAKATAQEAKTHNVYSPWTPLVLYVVDFLQHDAVGMEREAAAEMGKPSLENQMFFLESETAAYGGEFAKARELTDRASDSAQRADQKETAAEYEAHAAIREALAGEASMAKQRAQAPLAMANGKNVRGFAAVALGLAGDSARAGQLAAELSKRFPEDTIVQFDYLPMIRAAIALRSGEPGKAVEALAPAAPYELGHTNSAITFALYPVYLRGEAYLEAQQGAAAEVEFRKIVDHLAVVGNEPIGALAHLGLGRAYALAGESAKAKTAYQDFFALWKNADPDVPILKQAKAEYAKLK